MANPITVFCDVDFLVSFFKRAPEGSPLDYDDDDYLWLELHRLLRDDGTNIVVDATIEEVEERETILRDLIGQGRFRRVTFDPDRHRDIGALAFHECRPRGSVFFIEGVDHDVLSTRFGALFVSSAGVYDVWRRIGRQRTLNVEPDTVEGSTESTLQSMSDLALLASPTTRLVVCDRYLIAELRSRDSFEENLGGLLLALLPEGPNEIPIRVAIVSKLYDDRKGFLLKPEEAQGRVETFLRERRPRLRVEVSVVQPRQIPHDRRVFTDYGLFNSSYGWALFGKGGGAVKDTTLQYSPAFDSDLRAIAAAKLHHVQVAAGQPGLAFEGGKPVKLTAGDVAALFE